MVLLGNRLFFDEFSVKNLEFILLILTFFPLGFFEFANTAELDHLVIQLLVECFQVCWERVVVFQFAHRTLYDLLANFFGQAKNWFINDVKAFALLLIVDWQHFVDQIVFVDLVALTFPDFSIVDIQVPQALSEGGIEKVFNAVVSIVFGEFFCDDGPFFAMSSDEMEQEL